ncbi:DegV family protein [Corynebacterium freneyi]|uniref:DegV family protein with EDD domain n=1 Tax=Corynebacterium freneyi TaxID=134034 RepID=A0ABS4U9H5_9CORY|nr:DegV family protein [Corynebacterium freneyi]MBP2333171.1 DegV family protein with EDD domain [Corynebacterium freneyi]WJZ04726.1 DegV domain-containing protein [Corynebacterium freneyi]
MTGVGERGAGRVQVVVDESACLDDAVARRHGITVVPLGLDEVDGEQTTSAIGPLTLCAAYARALERGGDAGVVALHLGKGLSATWSNAMTAAAVLERVTVVDSTMVGAGMGAAAIAAAEKAAEGADLEECVAAAEGVLARNRLWLYVPKLEPLRRGGRISTGQAVLSTALAIKPIVGIQDGALGLVAKCRTEAKVLDKLVDFAATEAAGRPAHVMLQHSGADERVEELHAMLSLALPEGSTFDVVDLPAAIAAHTGPRAFAVGMVVAEDEAEGADADAGAIDDGDDAPLPPASVVGRDASPLFTSVAAKLPTWSENRRAAIEKAEALAHAIAELARRDNSDPEGAAFGRDAREEAAQKAADKVGDQAGDKKSDETTVRANERDDDVSAASADDGDADSCGDGDGWDVVKQ